MNAVIASAIFTLHFDASESTDERYILDVTGHLGPAIETISELKLAKCNLCGKSMWISVHSAFSGYRAFFSFHKVIVLCILGQARFQRVCAI